MPVLGNLWIIRYDTFFLQNSICSEGTSYSHGLMDLKYKWISKFTSIVMETKSDNFCSWVLEGKTKEHMEKYKDIICIVRGSKIFVPKCDTTTEVNEIKKVRISEFVIF